MSIHVPSHLPHNGGIASLVVIGTAVLQILTPLLSMFGIGETIGSQSGNVRTLITPAGWAFSIWGALYTGSLLFAVYQLLPAQRQNGLLVRLRWPIAGAFLGNAVWAAYTQIAGLSIVSVVIIAWTLACLLTAFRRLDAWDVRLTGGERWLAMLPISALTAWLTVAAIVNIAAALRFHGVEAGPAAPVVAASIVVVGGAIAAAVLVRSHGNPPYAAVFLWALAGIYAAGAQAAGIVAAAVAVAALLILGGAAGGLRRNGARFTK